MTQNEKKEIEVVLKVNDQGIELNQFANDILGNGILGLLSPLRGVDDVKTVTITFKVK